VLVVASAWLVGLTGGANAASLNRDPSVYCIFAQKSLSLKNIKIDSACNVGGNCAQPSQNATCGTGSFEDAKFVDGSQLASDKVGFNRPGAVVDDLFTNKPFNSANVTASSVQGFATPIIAGTCDASCNASSTALETFCGFPSPFPDCDPAKLVVAEQGEDCSAFDSSPGNGACDLPPGTYGDIRVQNLAEINLSAGSYNVCSFSLGKNAEATGNQSFINIADDGFLRVNNESKVGVQQCGDFTFRIEGHGTVNFGRNVVLAAQVCAPNSDVSLGHGNVLLGQFIGLNVNADRNNSVRICCECVCP
jgi:hypothetical protein